MTNTRRQIIKGLGAAAGAGVAAGAKAATWTPISRNNQANTMTWKPMTVDSGAANTWRKVGRQQVANCGGYLPAGYCAGNAKYIPPNGNWASWGLGFSATNVYGYTGTLTNCSTVSVNPIVDANGDWNYCNCGANCTFYYVNCNCNCNCNCANCNCGGFCCFPKGTRVRLADGTVASIEEVEAGAELAALHGVSTVDDLVICVVKPGDTLFRVNGSVECTSEQLFLSREGAWLAVSVDGYREYRAHLQEGNPDFGLNDDQFRQMVLGDVIHAADGLVEVVELETRVVSEEEHLHSFVLSGVRTFYANDYVVESRISKDACFDLSGLAQE